MSSFAIVFRRAYFEAKKRRKYAKNLAVNRSVSCRSSRMQSLQVHSSSLLRKIQTLTYLLEFLLECKGTIEP